MDEDNSSEGSIKCEQSDEHHIKPVSHITATSSMKSLMYKSIKIQQKNYCSNICQIITPLLCIMFTLVIKIITSDVVSSKVSVPEFPKPMNMPLLFQLLPLDLSCKEIYLFEFQNSTMEQRQRAEELLQMNLKRFCEQTDQLSPVFNYTNELNKRMVQLLFEADKEQFERGNDLKTELADGIIKFRKLSSKQFDVSLAVNDYRLAEYHRNNGVTKMKIATNDSIFTGYIMTTEGMMQLIEKVTRPYLLTQNSQQVIMGTYMYMPFDGQDRTLVDKTVNVVGSGLYPLGLSLLLPLFLYMIVSQKEERLLEIMKMNGLNIKYYWINTFIFNFLISIVTFLAFYLFGFYVINLSFFTETGVVLFWTVLIGWAIAQISLTTFVQIFVNNAKSATIIGYLLSIFSTLVGEALSITIHPFPMEMPLPILLFPPFCLCRIITMIGLACSTGGCYQSISSTEYEMKRCIVILYGWFFMFLVSIWLNDKIQQQYGVAKTPKCVESIKRCLVRRNEEEQIMGQTEFQLEQSIKNHYDESINKLNRQVSLLPIDSKPLITKGVSKKYKKMSGAQNYVALKPFNLAIEERQIFGLLGPNGAGKTTLISVLTGMYEKTEGNAWINGLPVGQSQTNSFIGVCPQFDLLWPSLTVYEHLKFYALLKGVPSEQLQSKIQQSLKDVDLFDSQNMASKQLSGGMQRRLSIAISLVANPSIVFLDEPSSGLDPSHRRKMWDILLKCKRKTSIFLTTHLMEEAEALCDRVGIISKGQLKCIGTPAQLKQLHGQGYRLHLNFQNIFHPNNQNVTEEIKTRFDAKVISELDSRVSLKVQKQRILECIGWLKKEKGISWLVSQPSLYDVFINFIN